MLGTLPVAVAWPVVVLPVVLVAVILVSVASTHLGPRGLFLALATVGALACLVLGIVWLDGRERVAGGFLILGAAGLFLGVAALAPRRGTPPPE